jgi:hypothetical protein
MSGEWACQAPRASARALARLSRQRGIGICEFGDELWLRGKSLSDELDRGLKLVPGARRYALLADGQLVPQGKLVPRGRLPEGNWLLLVDWLAQNLVLPSINNFSSSSAAAAVPSVQAAPLRLVRSSIIRDSALLETRLAAFHDYVLTAPQWRLDRWSYVATSDGRVLVRGIPLPPLPGIQWYENEAICAPLGFAWEPAVEAALIRRVLRLAPGESALLRPDGTWEPVAAEQWVRCTRSSVRLTAEALA